MSLSPALLAQILSDALSEQTETDNLGDGASLVFMDDLPIVDLFKASEFILKRIAENPEPSQDIVEAYENWQGLPE